MMWSDMRRVHDEAGTFIVLYALLLVAIFTMVAIVVDLGEVRAARTSAQSAADFAALSAGAALAGQNTVPPTSRPRLACREAVESISRDRAEFTPLAADVDRCDSELPEFGTDPYCQNGPPPAATTPQKTLVMPGGPYVVTIRYPVDDSTISDGNFTAGLGADDGERCERMQITILTDNPSFFAGVFGMENVDSEASSVVRGAVDNQALSVAALLLMEREGCGVLTTSGGGTSGLGVVVRAAGPNPGRINADSAGLVGSGNCTTNSNAGGRVIYGTALPGASGGPSISAEATSGGDPGTITLYSLSTGGQGSAEDGTGVSPGGTAGGIASRYFADQKYNGGTRTAIKKLHNTAYPLTAMTTADATTAGYTVLTCANNDGLLADGSTKVFVDCPTFAPQFAVFPTATEVVFSGNISVANNKILSFPVATEIYVRGCDACSGSNTSAISVAGGLYVNTGVTASPPADPDVSCAGRKGPGAGGSTTNKTVLATFSGSFDISRKATLCQTTVYLGKNELTYAIQTNTSGGPAIIQCSVTRPCPKTSGAGDGKIQVTGGTGNVDWTAPDQVNTEPTDLHPFDDLALWTESHKDSEIKGQGASLTEGVYFVPNAQLTFSGQASHNVPLNAQFFVRRLHVGGQGTLVMKPDPSDSIKIPIAGSFSLIR